MKRTGSWLLALALIGNGGLKLGYLLGVTEEVVSLQLHLVVKLKDVWDTRRQIERGYLFV